MYKAMVQYKNWKIPNDNIYIELLQMVNFCVFFWIFFFFIGAVFCMDNLFYTNLFCSHTLKGGEDKVFLSSNLNIYLPSGKFSLFFAFALLTRGLKICANGQIIPLPLHKVWNNIPGVGMVGIVWMVRIILSRSLIKDKILLSLCSDWSKESAAVAATGI